MKPFQIRTMVGEHFVSRPYILDGNPTAIAGRPYGLGIPAASIDFYSPAASLVGDQPILCAGVHWSVLT